MSEAKAGRTSRGLRRCSRSAWGEAERRAKREGEREDLRDCAVGLRVRPSRILCSRTQRLPTACAKGRREKRGWEYSRCVPVRRCGFRVCPAWPLNGSDAPITGMGCRSTVQASDLIYLWQGMARVRAPVFSFPLRLHTRRKTPVLGQGNEDRGVFTLLLFLVGSEK